MGTVKGRDKVDLFLQAQHGGFGLLLAKQFGGVKIDDKFSNAVKGILGKFSFPVLNFTFSASGKLLRKDTNDLKVATWLEELELRINLKPLGEKGGNVKDPDSALRVIGLLPSETTGAKEDPTVQISPDIENILKAIPNLAGGAGIISGLGLAIAPLFKPRPRVLHKAFIAAPREFGWYRRASEDVSQEGVHYTAAVLQVEQRVKTLAVSMNMTSDWVGGGVDNQEMEFKSKIKLSQPPPPCTPKLALERSSSELPIVLETADVMDILGIGETTLGKLVKEGKLTAFGDSNRRISKGSLLNLLGIGNEKAVTPTDSD